MARLTTAQQKRHKTATDILATKGTLTDAQTEYVFENYNEGATELNGINGAFFTPPGLARELGKAPVF